MQLNPTHPKAPLADLFAQALHDLRPFAGRFALTWRVALLCALVTGVAMVYHAPLAAISCYLVIFLMKQDAVANCVMAVGVVLLFTVVVVAMIPVINLSIDSPALRLAVMFGVSYLFLFIASATPLGEQAAIVALVVAFIMTLVTDVPIGQIGDQGLLAAWKMACMPMGLMILFNLVFGVPAQTHVRNRIVARLRAAAATLEAGEDVPEMSELLAEGNEASLQQMQLVRALHLVPAREAAWLTGAVETSYLLLLAAQAPGAAISGERRGHIAAAIRAAADRIARKERPAAPGIAAASETEGALIEALAGLERPDGGATPVPAAKPLLAADAVTDPRHQRYALKTSLAAVICYLIYTAIQWDGIHTALVTCYVAALGTTGETVRKLSLRIVGCLIGAAMGCAALILVMPVITSVGGLMVMVFGAILVAGWVSSGNERISYCGVQIALAFLLTTINGFGPSFEFLQAGNRIMGILLGIFVIYVIFTQFWPASILREVRADLAEVVARLRDLAGRPWPARLRAVSDAAQVNQRLDGLDAALDMARFEPRGDRAEEDTLAKLRDLRDELEILHRRIRFEREVPAATLTRLDSLRTVLEAGSRRAADDLHAVAD